MKSPVPSLRGAERSGNLVFSDSYKLRDCFAALAKTAFRLFYEPIIFYFVLSCLYRIRIFHSRRLYLFVTSLPPAFSCHTTSRGLATNMDE